MGKAPDIPALTGLRFVAAATIVFSHFANNTGVMLFGLPNNYSAVGMPLFFTLSGFIVHYVYAAPFARGWRGAVSAFALARFSRLYPLFFALIALYLVGRLGRLFYAHPGIGLSYLSLTGTWWYWAVDGHAFASEPYSISWSISTEVFFYALYAVALYRIAALTGIRRCTILLVGLTVVAYTVLYAVFATQDAWEAFVLARHPDFVSRSADFENSFYRWLLYISPYFHLPEFISGSLMCQIYLLARKADWAIRRSVSEALGWLGVGWIVGAYVLLHLDHPDISGQFLSFIRFLHMNFLMAPGCCLLLLSLALGGSSIARVLARRVPTYLGDISYSIYLSHPLVLMVMMLAGFGASSYVLTVGFVLVVIASSLLYFAIERPGKAWLRAMFGTVSAMPVLRPAAGSADVEDAGERVAAKY